MSNRSTEDGKTTLENGESGLDEGSKCLEQGAGSGSAGNRLVMGGAQIDGDHGDTKLSCCASLVSWALLALCIALLITIGVLVVAWPRRLNPGLPCAAPECLHLAAEHVQRLEAEADACSEPRSWACGGWLRDNARRLPTRPSWSQQEDIKLQELSRVREALSTMEAPRSTESLEWRLKTLYESCMAVDFLDQDGYRPLDRIIGQLGGWHVRREWSARAWSWRVALETLQARHGVTPLFAASLTWRGNATALLLRPAPLGLPHPSFYQAPSDSSVVKAYKVLLKDAALSLDASTHNAARFADDIFSFEKRLADLLLGEEDDATETMTMQSLSGDTVHLPFQSMLQAMFPRIFITDSTEVLVSSPRYITYLLSVTTSTSDSILNDYFTWTLIREYLPYLSTNFRLIWQEFRSHITGSTEDLSRWELCAGLVQKIAPLGTLALLKTEKEKEFSRHDTNFETSQHAVIQDIFETIKRTAVKTVTASTNIDGETKSLMLEQLRDLKLQIGLKSHERSPDFLELYHKGFTVQKHDLFRNIGYALEFERELIQSAYNDVELSFVRENARKLILPEASYNSHTKTVLLPSALATPPFFHSHHPRFVQYARVGVTLGVAVARALAVMLPDAEADGAVPKYAAPTVHCLLDLLQGGVHVNLTSQSTAAVAATYVSVVGASLALDAARIRRPNTDVDSMLPQLDRYYRETLFALSYAQSLCSMHTPEQALLDRINAQIDGETMFRVAWPQIAGVQESLECSVTDKCPRPI